MRASPTSAPASLRIHANARGDAASALALLARDAARRDRRACVFERRGQGPLQATVDLFLPFKDFVHRQVLIHGRLDGAERQQARLERRGPPMLTATSISTAAQVARADIHGQLLGGAFQMQARTPRNKPVTRTQLEFRGTVSGDGRCARRSSIAGSPCPSAVKRTGAPF